MHARTNHGMAHEQQQQQQQEHLASCLCSNLQLSKSNAGRQQLIGSGELVALAAVLPQWTAQVDHSSIQSTQDGQQLLVLLRTLRNCCAAGSTAARVLQDNNVHAHVVQLATSAAQVQATAVDQQQSDQQKLLLLASLQLLANMCAASNDAACAIWSALYGPKLQAILGLLQGDVHEVAALTALNCIKANSKALADLTSQTAGAVWLQLLAPVMAASAPAPSSSSAQQQLLDKAAKAAPAAGDGTTPGFSTAGNDNLCLLVKAVALQYDCLNKLMQCLQISAAELALDAIASKRGDATTSSSHQPGAGSGGSSTSSSLAAGNDWSSCSTGDACSSSQQAALGLPGFRPNLAHAVLLHILQLEVETVPLASDDARQENRSARSLQPQHPQQQVQSPLAWLHFLVCLLQEMSAQVSRSEHGRSSVAAHVLEATLQVLKAVVAREDAGRGLLQCAAPSPASTPSAGTAPSACSDCIEQLHAQGLVQQLLGMLQQLAPPPKARQQEAQQQQQQQEQQNQAQQQQQQPYAGYRADLIAVLSNMVHGRRSIQDEVLAAGGIELLLNNCNLDDTAPLAREWALWSIRNMCKDNEAVQQYIAKFQAVEAVQSAELDRIGKQLQLDKMTNKLQLVDKPKPQS